MLAFETILVKDFVLQNTAYHERRMNQTRERFFGAKDFIRLDFASSMPDARCRVIYDAHIQSIEFMAYNKLPIGKLQFVNKDIDYDAKWLDRASIDMLEDGAIIVKNGLITDTKIANIAFFDGNHWLSPTTPLLNGTTRARLIDTGFLKLANLRPSDIMPHYKIAIMNALRGFEEIGTAMDVITNLTHFCNINISKSLSFGSFRGLQRVVPFAANMGFAHIDAQH